jgi:hypothetical protein
MSDRINPFVKLARTILGAGRPAESAASVRANAPPLVESLEERRMMSATVAAAPLQPAGFGARPEGGVLFFPITDDGSR